MDSTAASTPANPPQCHCRACNQVMDAKFQIGSARIPGHFIVTCTNSACWMHEYTFTDSYYPSVDLADYQPAA